MTRTPPLPNCYWLPDAALLAGEYPGAEDAAEAGRKLRLLHEAGVDTFLDLTEAGELEPYESVLETIAHETRGSPAYYRLAVRDLSTPTPEQMHRILDLIDAEQARGRTVYLHCWGGVGRTGTVVGCWLVRHGLTGPAGARPHRRAVAGAWRSAIARRGRPRPTRSGSSCSGGRSRRGRASWAAERQATTGVAGPVSRLESADSVGRAGAPMRSRHHVRALVACPPLAPLPPPSRTYGHGRPRVLHRRHGPRDAGRRQPLRGRVRRAAGDAVAAALARDRGAAAEPGAGQVPGAQPGRARDLVARPTSRGARTCSSSRTSSWRPRRRCAP